MHFCRCIAGKRTLRDAEHCEKCFEPLAEYDDVEDQAATQFLDGEPFCARSVTSYHSIMYGAAIDIAIPGRNVAI